MAEGSKVNQKSCGIVVYHDDHFLLLHYPQGHWDFVKGHVEKDETETQTAVRELEEETGIKHIELKDGFREKMHYKFLHEGELIHKDVFYFLGEVKSREVEISHEHQNHVWLPFKEAMERLTFKNAHEILQKAYDFLV